MALRNASLVFLAIALIAQVVCVDWSEIYNKNRYTARLIEATNEPLNNASPYEQVHYSAANLSHDFKSSTKFQPRGMAHLYLLTEKFINFIGKDEAFPDGSYRIVSFYFISIYSWIDYVAENMCHSFHSFNLQCQVSFCGLKNDHCTVY